MRKPRKSVMKFQKEKLKFYTGIVFLLIALAVTSCKTSPIKAYRQLQQKKPGSGIDAIAFDNLKTDTDYTFKLKTTDSVMAYGDSVKIYSYHKNYNIALEANKKYKVSVSGLCDCLGFRKQVILPIVFVKDPDRNIVATERQKEDHQIDYRYGPISVNLAYVFNSTNAGYYKMMLYTLNKEPGLKIDKLLPGIFIVSTVKGEFHIKIEELKS